MLLPYYPVWYCTLVHHWNDKLSTPFPYPALPSVLRTVQRGIPLPSNHPCRRPVPIVRVPKIWTHTFWDSLEPLLDTPLSRASGWFKQNPIPKAGLHTSSQRLPFLLYSFAYLRYPASIPIPPIQVSTFVTCLLPFHLNSSLLTLSKAFFSTVRILTNRSVKTIYSAAAQPVEFDCIGHPLVSDLIQVGTFASSPHVLFDALQVRP
jgi:hypothetical protein